MSKSYPCIETKKIGKNFGDRIIFNFCFGDSCKKKKQDEESDPFYCFDDTRTAPFPEIAQEQEDDEETCGNKKGFPIRVVIQYKDIDPSRLSMSVEEFFEEYRLLHNQQVENNLRVSRREYTAAQKRQRAEDKKRIRAYFENELHYEIADGCVEDELDKIWPENEMYVQHVEDLMTGPDGEQSDTEYFMPHNNTLEAEYFGTDRDEAYLLREFAKTLEPGSLLYAVYYHMLYRTNQNEFAKEIGKSRRTVLYLRKRVKQMAREYIEEHMDDTDER